jgi:MYXO-CTERM domain-containing protein
MNVAQYGSPAVCGDSGQCETAPTYTATTTATVASTPTATQIAQGGDCTDPAECSTTFCVDGVCCDTECTDPLMQCNLPGQEGTCASTAAAAPALTPWGLIAGLVLLAGTGAWAMRRRWQ